MERFIALQQAMQRPLVDVLMGAADTCLGDDVGRRGPFKLRPPNVQGEERPQHCRRRRLHRGVERCVSLFDAMKYVTTKSELDAAVASADASSNVLGLFADSHMAYELDRWWRGCHRH